MEYGEEEIRLVGENFSNYYVLNPNNDLFLERHQFRIQLEGYHCYCYGNTSEGIRGLCRFQFMSIEKGGYHVYVEEEQKVVYVKDLISLRRDYFHFVDRTSLLRSSFLYDPVEKKFFRLHCLHLFLYLPSLHSTRWVGFVSKKKKNQILRKVELQYQKIQKSLWGEEN